MIINRLLTADEVAEILHVKKKSIYQMIYRSQIPCVKLGRTLRFSADDIEAYINQGKRTPMKEA